MIEEIAKIDKALDELLVNLGSMVLRLASPEVTRTEEERHALTRSVNQFSNCARHSSDTRVRTLAGRLEATLTADHSLDDALIVVADAASVADPADPDVTSGAKPGTAVRPLLRLVVSR